MRISYVDNRTLKQMTAPSTAILAKISERYAQPGIDHIKPNQLAARRVTVGFGGVAFLMGQDDVSQPSPRAPTARIYVLDAN